MLPPVAVKVFQALIIGETSGHRAEWQRDQDGAGGAWISTRLPGTRLTRNAAIASIDLAEVEYAGYGNSPNAAALRAELGI